MNDHEIRLSRRESERLLDDPAAHDSALGWALSAINAPAHRGEGGRRHADPAFGGGRSRAVGLAADVDHARRAGVVEVSEAAHAAGVLHATNRGARRGSRPRPKR